LVNLEAPLFWYNSCHGLQCFSLAGGICDAYSDIGTESSGFKAIINACLVSTVLQILSADAYYDQYRTIL
jgi:hypothetical protein